MIGKKICILRLSVVSGGAFLFDLNTMQLTIKLCLVDL